MFVDFKNNFNTDIGIFPKNKTENQQVRNVFFFFMIGHFLKLEAWGNMPLPSSSGGLDFAHQNNKLIL